MARMIFLSYSRDEADLARKLRAKLARAGFHVWMDETQLEIGEDWKKAIEDAIKSSSSMVVALSPSAATSKYVKEEIDIAFNSGVRPFPIIVHGKEQSAVPDFLKDYQFQVAVQKEFNSGVTKLIQNLYDYAAIRRPHRWWYPLAIGLILLLAIAVLVLSWKQFTQKTVPSISLVSVRYMASGYDPHLIDFRTAAEDGIPFGVGQSLRMTDVWIWGSLTSADYQAQVQLYINGELMGATESTQPLKRGIYPLGDIIPTRDFFEETTNAWLIQKSWEVLDLRLVLFQGDTVIHEEHFPIKHNANGLSRMLGMPLANVVTVLYSLNNGPIQVMDLGSIVQMGGLALHVGDQFTLHKIWYKTDTTTTAMTFEVSAYLTAGGYNDQTYRTSDSVVFDDGLHFIDTSKTFNWLVDQKYNLLVISLERNDEALIDRLSIPLN